MKVIFSKQLLVIFIAVLFMVCCTYIVYAAEDILLEPGQSEFDLKISISGVTSAFAGADVDVLISNFEILDIKVGDSGQLAIVFAANGINLTGPAQDNFPQRSYMMGFGSPDALNSFNGDVDVCTITFSYTGSEPCTITVGNIRLRRFAGESAGKPVYETEVLNQEYVYNIRFRAPGDPAQGDLGAGGPGSGNENGGGGTGGTGTDGSVDGGGGGNGDGTGTSGGATNGENAEDTSGNTAPVEDLGSGTAPGGGAETAASYAPFISGYPDGTVLPDANLTRAELAQIIYNLYATDENYQADYSDMDASHWAYVAVGYCQDMGYMVGYPEGGFEPERLLTRAELSTAFARIKKLDLTADHDFIDVGSHWAVVYIGAVYQAGYIVGYPNGTFQPDNDITRAEAVTLICRADGRNEKLYDNVKTFTDIDKNHWGYDYVMHAANGYNYFNNQ